MTTLRRSIFRALAFAAVLSAPSAASSAVLYVTAEDGGEVIAIDPDAGKILTRIPVGKRPRGIKLSPDGARLYVALSGSPRGGPGIDVASGKVLRRIKVGGLPWGLVVKD